MSFAYWYMFPVAILVATIAMASGVGGGPWARAPRISEGVGKGECDRRLQRVRGAIPSELTIFDVVGKGATGLFLATR